MSELSSYVQRSSHAVLSSSDLAAIQHQVRKHPGGLNGPAIDFELRSGGPVFGAVPLRAFPAAWSGWSIAPDAVGIGLCLPVDGAGHLGVAMNRRGEATWFSIDDGWAWGDTPPACQLLDDVCRTRLGLSTEPPDRLPDWFWLGQWLADVVDTAGVGDMLDVITVASAHPAVDVDELSDLDMDGLAGFMIERHREHVAIADWTCIHLDAAVDVDHRFHDLAMALDVGAFSRWVSAACPPLSDLATTLTVSCTPLGLRLVGSVISDMVIRQRLGGERETFDDAARLGRFQHRDRPDRNDL